MSAKAIREFDGKHLLAYWLPRLAYPTDAVSTPVAAASSSPLSVTADAAPAPSFLAPTRMVHLAFDASLLHVAEGEDKVAKETAFANHVNQVFQVWYGQ